MCFEVGIATGERRVFEDVLRHEVQIRLLEAQLFPQSRYCRTPCWNISGNKSDRLIDQKRMRHL